MVCMIWRSVSGNCVFIQIDRDLQYVPVFLLYCQSWFSLFQILFFIRGTPSSDRNSKCKKQRIGKVHSVGFPISWLVWQLLVLFTVFLVSPVVPKTSQLSGLHRNIQNISFVTRNMKTITLLVAFFEQMYFQKTEKKTKQEKL